MRLVKRALHFVALMALLVSFSFDFGGCASAQQSAPAGIVGRWRSLGASKGGIGEVWEFRSDGTVDYSPGAVVGSCGDVMAHRRQSAYNPSRHSWRC
jgi:hypothetical protein